ncbi:subtilase cytotoxin subunit B [Salmonella enterica]|uniref:Subtilase cytotoxin subunit B n=1 Tax=Salmonella diarizonae TaxID=59204 RepID=A0A6C8XXG1_SALDZ|nr:subtilase cytotoxin subunit B [Salmonella enterica]ECF6858589.1 subtilase cytotoxin subunit B [Salmonella enterica subsp. arizonae]ECJ2856857.1 subtilase cytotoxin subunit B [Salmonella enterica subsp. diarizonae]EDW1844635.1 subtilase cytotoxin subunit B [Salmonella enterica subsp. enterica]EAX8240463.1 subtilase cytotoxin subunit B [Salmonella enterica]
MKKITPVCALLSLICSFNASAEWTGDYHSISYFSYRVISEFHVGQIDGGDYFCIKTVKVDGSGTPIIACSVSNKSVWAPSFKVLLEQAKYFYNTGQSVRIYYQDNIWIHKSFVNTFSTNALVGLSSCSATACFGPERPERK